jgi:hypothetical protein
MELLTVIGIVYLIGFIGLCEYIYWYRYVPNMKRAALNNYEDL